MFGVVQVTFGTIKALIVPKKFKRLWTLRLKKKIYIYIYIYIFLVRDSIYSSLACVDGDDFIKIQRTQTMQSQFFLAMFFLSQCKREMNKFASLYVHGFVSKNGM